MEICYTKLWTAATKGVVIYYRRTGAIPMKSNS